MEQISGLPSLAEPRLGWNQRIVFMIQEGHCVYSQMQMEEAVVEGHVLI